MRIHTTDLLLAIQAREPFPPSVSRVRDRASIRADEDGIVRMERQVGDHGGEKGDISILMDCPGGNKVTKERGYRLPVGEDMDLSIALLTSEENEPADGGDAENRLKAVLVRRHQTRCFHHIMKPFHDGPWTIDPARRKKRPDTRDRIPLSPYT